MSESNERRKEKRLLKTKSEWLTNENEDRAKEYFEEGKRKYNQNEYSTALEYF